MGGALGETARRVVSSVLEGCQPGVALASAWPGELDGAERVVVIGAGKGSVGMARACVDRLGDRVTRGVVIGPEPLIAGARFGRRIEALAADHPMATARNVDAARRALEVARAAPRRI